MYADEVVFWQDVIRKTLASRNEDAERAFRQALAIDPANAKAAVNLGLLREGALLPKTTKPR